MLNIKQNLYTLRDDVYNFLKQRKNLIFYDGLMDGLNENIMYKFFYSNPNDALEFIILDVFRKPDITKINQIKTEIFGVLEIVKKVGTLKEGLTENIYGYTIVEETVVRGLKKHRVRLYINENGYADILNAIGYFENYICDKGIS